jgi:hypothetical protein
METSWTAAGGFRIASLTSDLIRATSAAVLVRFATFAR